MSFIPTVDSGIYELAPGFRAISIVVDSQGIRDTSVADTALEDAYAVIRDGKPAWASAHLDAWAEVFRKFGLKRQRATSSAEALRKRVLRDGLLPKLDPVVDLYNAISLRFAVPVGGENRAAYHGTPRLAIATGAELFDTIKDGEPINENPSPGEVIWRDDIGVTCRRWNWRQGVRTRLTADSTKMWFVLESLPEMPLGALEEAEVALESGLRSLLDVTYWHSSRIGQPDLVLG